MLYSILYNVHMYNLDNNRNIHNIYQLTTYIQHTRTSLYRYFWDPNGKLAFLWAAAWQNQQNDSEPSEDSDQPGHPPSLIRVFPVCMKKAWVLNYLLNAQRRLWSESTLDAHVSLLVLSCGGSYRKTSHRCPVGVQHLTMLYSIVL